MTSRRSARHRTSDDDKTSGKTEGAPPKRHTPSEAWLKARREYEEAEAQMTPAEKKAREARCDEIRQMATRMLAPFAAMSIVDHIDQATDDLRELIADHSISAQQLDGIARAYDSLRSELQVARAMAGPEAE